MWWSGRALGLDFETDGPAPTEARAIQGALVHLTGPGVTPATQEFEWLIQPERDIPQEAVDVHGITTERARDEGVPRELAIGQMVATMADLAGPEVPVTGHNVIYDLTLLDREMRRLGIGRMEIEGDDFGSIDQVKLMIGGQKAAIFPVLDTLVLDKVIDKYRKGSRRLVDVARHYGVPIAEGATHGALADTIASLRIAITLANRGAWADKDLPDLYCAQVRWKREQAEGLRDYFAAKGQESAAASVSLDWPLQSISLDESRAIADATF